MKGLKDIIASSGKTIAKTAVVASLAVASLLPYSANGQSIFPEHSLNAAMVPYNQPNIHIANGLDSLDYHGSGSLGSEVTQADVDSAKTGVYRYQLDVDGDTDVDSNDVNLIQKYVNKEIDHLPGHWNMLNGIGKRDWYNKYLVQSPTRVMRNGLPSSCGDYAIQESINTFGIEKPELMNENDYNWSQNGRWNIPVNSAFVNVTLGINPDITAGNDGHWINAVLVGPNTEERFAENPLKRNHYVFSEPQTSQVVVPGDFSISTDGPIRIHWYGHNARGPPWNLPITTVEFDLSVDPENATNYYDYALVLENPNKVVADTIAPTYTEPTDFTVEYSKSNDLEKLVNDSRPTDASDNDGVAPKEEISYSVISENEVEKDVEISYSATDTTGNSKSSTYMMFIRDTMGPVITGGKDSPVLNYQAGFNFLEYVKDRIETQDSSELENIVTVTEAGSTFTNDGTINQVQGEYSVNVSTTDWKGNVGESATVVVPMEDMEEPVGELSDNLVVYKEGENFISKIKELTAWSDDNSQMPLDTIVRSAGTEGMYNVFLGDLSGNEGLIGQVEAKKDITDGIDDFGNKKSHALKVFNDGENLKINYFADGNESVRIQQINAGTGQVEGTLERHVMNGENELIIPNASESRGVKVVRVIDEDQSNVQTKKFVQSR